jgi:disulfide oxidoreductase YuzD
MGRGTLVDGWIVFRINLTEDEKRELINKIKNELELYPDGSEAYLERYIKEENNFRFQHVNWSNPINKKKVEKLLNEIKDKLEDYCITVYFLNATPDIIADSDIEGIIEERRAEDKSKMKVK